MTSITTEVCKEAGVKPRDAERSKNFFALGWSAGSTPGPIEPTLEWIAERFGGQAPGGRGQHPGLQGRLRLRRDGRALRVQLRGPPGHLRAGRVRPTSPATRPLAWGLIAAARLAGLPLFLGSYPITPASDILHELSKHKEFGVRTFQAEDEIAGIGAALGAPSAGRSASPPPVGPGIDLKSETIGLAINLELPLVIVDVQRGGPSTGLPTKTEQADLLHAMYGRHGEAPLPIVAPRPRATASPRHRGGPLAVKYRTPVILLSDGYLANGAEPWRLPDLDGCPPSSRTSPPSPTTPTRTAPRCSGPTSATRDPGPPLGPARAPRARAPHRRPREGRRQRQRLLRRGQPRAHGPPAPATRSPASPRHPAARGQRRDGDAQLLLVGWGSTYAAVAAGVKRVRARGMKVAHAHLRHLNPFPSNLGEVLSRYTRCWCPRSTWAS
jgi:2-oxoglutarate ferredoxin oxidoreductase subunit alpha